MNKRVLQQLEFNTIFKRPGRLISYTRRCPDVPLLTFLQSANGEQRIYWESEQADVSFAGCGVAVQFVADGPKRFNTIRAQIAELYAEARVSGPAVAAPRVFGGFSFSGDTPDADPLWAAFPAAYFMLPHCQLTRVDGQSWLTINRYVTDPDAEWGDLRDEHAALADWLRRVEAEQPSAPGVLSIEYPVSPAKWHDQIGAIRRAIANCEVDKVVLSRTADIKLTDDVDILHTLAALKQQYANTYRFLIEPLPGHAFFGATPELLANLRDKRLKTAGLAGSWPRGDTTDADDQLARGLLHSSKDRHEHALVVEALCDALRPVTSELHIPVEPTIMRLANIQHLYTPIEATLSERANILDVVERLHPTPALGGYPRQAALKMIESLEVVSRGWYGAPIGWVDYRGNGMFVVAIRSAVGAHRQVRLYSGAGIMGDSDPDKEWEETRIKFKPMLSALGGHDASA